jgi:apolipoprotein N-acyltransferase
MTQHFPKSGALLLGLASATGFAPLNLWPITLICFAVLMQSVFTARDRRGALARGYWFGVGHFTLGLNWIAGSFRYQDAMPVWLGWVAVVALSLYLAVYPAMASGLAWRYGRDRQTSRDRIAPFILIFAVAWMVTEWLRASMFTGFAWDPLGVAFVHAAGLAKGLGTYGLSGVAVLAAGAIWLCCERQWIAAGGAATLPLLSVSIAIATLPHHDQDPRRPLLHIVQPNIGQEVRNRPDAETLRGARLTALSGQPGPIPRLILWPEAAAPGFIESEAWNRTQIASVLGPKDALLAGGDALVYDKAGQLIGARNSLFVVMPDSTLLARYDKSHLVPYGEYLALRWLLEPLGATRLVPGDLDFLPGPGPQSFAIPGFGKIGVQICYEIIFSGQVIDRANRPDFLFNPSNDAWFGTWGPPQHLAQARMRAIEEGLPVVRSTPTGISAIIDADGRIVRSIPYKSAGSITAPLPTTYPPTLFARYGNILPFVFALALTLIGIALRRRLR